MNWYFGVLKKYAVFNGRARRKEYWMFLIFNLIILFVLAVIEGMIAKSSSQGILAIVYNLAVFVPTIAVGVRRMHDTDHSGWWLLFPIMNFLLTLTEGTEGKNRFGSDPKSVSKRVKHKNIAGLR
jgi:uncharacterized membrane protein YhaH (DUF805 family)